MFRDYSNYDVLADGRIWSKYSNKFLKPATRKDGYQQVVLVDNEGKRHVETLHKVVFCAVNGLWNIPEGMQINHKSEEKQMNAIWNLELVSAKQNCNHGTRNERIAKAHSKRVGAYDKNGELVMTFHSTKEARRLCFYQGHVAACCRGERKTHKGYVWKYLDDEQ